MSRAPRLTLHVGQHKTGSKALQSFLAHNRRALLDRGLLYPVDDEAGAGIRAYAISHFRLFALLRREALRARREEDAAEAYWGTFGRYCRPFETPRDLFRWVEDRRREAGAGQVVLSAEDLFDMHTAHELDFAPELVAEGARRLAGLASEFGYDARVVVYLRRPDHLLGAHYVQYLKGSPARDVAFEEFARAFAPRLDARRLLASWSEAFGPGRVLVRPYEAAALPGGIVPDFFDEALGLAVPAGCAAPPADAESVNRTLDRDHVEYLRILNRLAARGRAVFPREAILDAALRAAGHAGDRGGIASWLSPAGRRALLARHADGIAAIARDLLGRDDGRLFAESRPADDATWRPYPGLSPERAAEISLAIHEAVLAQRPPGPCPGESSLCRTAGGPIGAGVQPTRTRRPVAARIVRRLRRLAGTVASSRGDASRAGRLGAGGMDDRRCRPRPRAIPVGLLGMIGLVVAVESALDRQAPRFKTAGVIPYYHAARARDRASRYDVLCLGDSLVKDGLLPRVIEGRTGRRAYNLALPGASPAATFFLLRGLLDAGARPSALVVDFQATVIAADFRGNLAGLAEIVLLRDVLDLAWTARDARAAATLALAHLLPSFRDRPEIREQILAALGGRRSAARADVPPLLRNLEANAGALVLAEDPRAATAPEFWNERANLRAPWACDPVNALYIRRTLALAGARGIPVDWILPPIHPRVQAGRERLGLDAAYTRFVRSVRARQAHVRVLDGRPSGYAPEVFVDATHLDSRGAFVLSEAVATALLGGAGPGGGPHWLALPPYRARPIDVPVEDLARSRVAVQEQGAPGLR